MKNRITAYLTIGDSGFWEALCMAGVDGIEVDDAMERAIDNMDDFELKQMMGDYEDDE